MTHTTIVWYDFDTSGCANTDWEVTDKNAPVADREVPVPGLTLNRSYRKFYMGGDAMTNP